MLRKILLPLFTHALVAFGGFAIGVYTLPILIAPEAPTDTQVQAAAQGAQFTAAFVRDLQDSDALHWGEGIVSIGSGQVVFDGELAPGPDYQLYFSPEFVETEADFNRLKPEMVWAGSVKTFDNFSVDLPAGLDPGDFNSVVVWCETFGQFITAGSYR